MQRTRRLLPDSQHTQRQRWEDTPEAKKYDRWFAGWERRLRLLKWATFVFAVQLVVWFILAWNYNPLHQWVFGSMFVTVTVPVYIIGWSVKELR